MSTFVMDEKDDPYGCHGWKSLTLQYFTQDVTKICINGYFVSFLHFTKTPYNLIP